LIRSRIVNQPLEVLAEDHFGGTLALTCAAICTALPLGYIVVAFVLRTLRGRTDPGPDRSDSNLAIGMGVFLAIAFGIALVPYWARFWMGETSTGEVVEIEERRRSGGDVRVFSIRLPDGRAFEEHVENEDIAAMTPGRRVHVRGVRGVRGFERLGREATLSQGTVFGSLAAWGALIAISLAFGRRSKRKDAAA
jgi:hypothetical protein